MIYYIKRTDLDVLKYDFCIENSIQSRVYAFSWYLDIVADNWDVLVLGDYEAVMPIPWKQKYFIKYISQPFFCQQLGVFSKDILSLDLILKMMKRIPKKFVKVTLNFNSENLSFSKMEAKKNYILLLNDTYQNLFKHFSKRRKRSIKAAQKNKLKLKSISVLELVKMKEKFYANISFNKLILENLANYALENKKGFILGVFNKDILLGGVFFLKSNKRIIYLFSSVNDEGRKLQAASFLIGSVIKEYENSGFILDFEGSNIAGIGSFFKSFGSKNENYNQIKYTNLLTSF